MDYYNCGSLEWSPAAVDHGVYESDSVGNGVIEIVEVSLVTKSRINAGETGEATRGIATE